MSQRARYQESEGDLLFSCFDTKTPAGKMVWWTIQRETRIQRKPASCFTQHVVIDHMRDVTVVPSAGVFIADVEETLHYLQGKYYRDINRKLQINILYPGICFMFM